MSMEARILVEHAVFLAVMLVLTVAAFAWASRDKGSRP